MNRKFPVLIIIVLLISIQSLSYGDATTYLPVIHRAYDFLERMEHKYYLETAHLGTKPVTRAEIARLVFGLEKAKGFLTMTERDELKCLLDEFSADLSSRKRLVWDDSGPVTILPEFLQGFIYRNRRNMFAASGNNYSLYADPVILSKASLGKVHDSSDKDNIYTSTNGFILRGTVGDHLGFHIDVRDSREWGSRDYPENTVTTLPGRGYAAFKGDHAEFDETNAHISYSRGPFILSYGRDRNVWGRGRRGTLMLSGYGSPYDMLRLETGFWRLKFMFFAAEIEQFPPIAKFYYDNPAGIPSDSVEVKKRLTGHRVEINVTDHFTLGFHETVVYGGRWDLSYLNPVMFLKGAEHMNGDHDNALMGMDFRLYVHRAHSLYGELLVDDITTTKLGTDWYGNKFAWQIGTFLIGPFGLSDVDSRIEYTRIKQWVYTHRYPVNSYSHYGDVLGHPLGPNSDEIFFELRKRFSRRFHTSLSFIKRRHGSVGGDPLTGFKDSDSKKAGFLDGDLEKTTRAGIGLSYELLWELFVKCGYQYEELNGDGVNIFLFSIGLNE